MPEKLKLLLTSRKFWAALVGLVVIVLKAWKPDIPLGAEELTGLVVLIVSYILGTAIEDGLSARAVGANGVRPPR